MRCMDLQEVRKEIKKTEQKRRLLDSIYMVEAAEDWGLLEEMKTELQTKYDALCEDEKKQLQKDQKRIRHALRVYRMLPVFSVLAVVILTLILIRGQKTSLLENHIVISAAYIVNAVLLFMHCLVASDSKVRVIIALLIGIPVFCYVVKLITGFDLLWFTKEVYISFALSIYSFVRSLVQDAKSGDKK